MDDTGGAYYTPLAQYSYYQQPPPPPGTAHQPPVPPPSAQLPHHHQYHPYQPPVPSYGAPLYTPPHSHDEVRTLFVAGLPEDVKPREIYNLFREFPGYESSHLRSPTSNTQPFAFAVFVDQQSAIAAMYELNGIVFDLEKGSTLFIDLAKSNSRSKRQRTDDDRPGSEKRMKGSAVISRVTESGVGNIHFPGMGSSAYNTVGYPPTQSYANFDGRAMNEGNANKSAAPPCPTLFVANLGPNCSEQELTQVFSRFEGIPCLKMQSTYGAPVAFVDFKDTACSTEALSHLQGTILYSSPGEGMRLEYAKSRMGMRSKKSR
nr:U2 small nuclear ribonucleoprotein B'' isoform X2 [Ipomoea batatas]